ncbi:hypothetical protein LSTR_LSTR001800 [Laodelphax striatellus]|uniref:Uncharacterized protein n=1 Tax=Laodelphax striatellus TaxID=195883 RepID=A0A482WGJ0_LAOST|nr:hypothetical protein LSTR_LSTR001800 [Laodelphax striatellus]
MEKFTRSFWLLFTIITLFTLTTILTKWSQTVSKTTKTSKEFDSKLCPNNIVKTKYQSYLQPETCHNCTTPAINYYEIDQFINQQIYSMLLQDLMLMMIYI